MNYLSVCSGIEAASCAWHALGWTPVAFSEIEPFPSAVLKHHYPAVPNLGDMTKFHEWPDFKSTPVDILVGGTPCQAFSVAGLREGLNDPRGNLTLTFLGVAAKYQPEWVVWENVPGVISDKTGALESLLSGLEELGYVVDIEIMDAQYFGLAQRRRRVFICAQDVNYLICERTTSSALTIAQCLTETLHAICIARSESFANARESSDSASLSEYGARRRMKLFGIAGVERCVWPQLLANLEEVSASYHPAQKKSAYRDGECEADFTAEDLLMDSMVALLFTPTGLSLKGALEDAFQVMKLFITSTATSTITDYQIYTCSKAVLRIGGLIVRLRKSCPASWQAGLSFLTAIQDFISYARQTNPNLPEYAQRVYPWDDFRKQAEELKESVKCAGGWASASAILFEPDGLFGNNPPSRKAREEITGTLSARTQGGGGLGTDFDLAGGIVARDGGGLMSAEIAPTLNAHFGEKQGLENQHIDGGGGYLSRAIAGTLCSRDAKSARMDADTNHLIPTHQGGFFDGPTHTLRASGFDASEDDTGRGTPIVTVPTLTSNGDNDLGYRDERGLVPVSLFQDSEFGVEEYDTAGSLRAGRIPAHQMIIEPQAAVGPIPAICIKGASIGRKPEAGPQFGEHLNELAYTQNCVDVHGVMTPSLSVRRLTPKECERLQGFPDHWTDVPYRKKPACDGPRYKALGNSMAVPCMKKIGEGIARDRASIPVMEIE